MSMLSEQLPIEKVVLICRKYKVLKLALFGSALTEAFDSSSDIDLLVEFDPDARVGFMTLARLQRELSELAKRRVDLVPKGGLKAQLRDTILSSAKVLYEA